MSNPTSAELPRNRLTFLDNCNLKMAFNFLLLRKHTEEFLVGYFQDQGAHSYNNHLGTIEIPIY